MGRVFSLIPAWLIQPLIRHGPKFQHPGIGTARPSVRNTPTMRLTEWRILRPHANPLITMLSDWVALPLRLRYLLHLGLEMGRLAAWDAPLATKNSLHMMRLWGFRVCREANLGPGYRLYTLMLESVCVTRNVDRYGMSINRPYI